MKVSKTLFVLSALCILLPAILFAYMPWTQATANAGWSARYSHTSVVFDNKIWVMGGYHPFRNDVWYSSDGVNWTQATANAGWSTRHFLTSVVFDNKIWVMGGYSSVPPYFRNDVWYSTDGVNWTQATANAGWSRTYGHTSVVFDNKIWVMGGITESGGGIGVWYSSDGVTWTQATANAGWSARRGHTSVVFDNKMWVMGGYSSGYKNDVWYSSNGVNWTRATANAGWSVRWVHTSVVFDNKMWVIGGCGNSFNNDVWYSTDGINWTQATANAGWSARNGHTSVVFDNKMWVMGGQDASAYKNDVWYSRGITSLITFNHTGLNSDFTGNVLNVDDTNYVYTDLPKSFSWVSGSSHTFQYYDTLSITGKRYIWTSTSGLALTKSGTIVVSDTGSVTGNYTTQYYLTLATNPPGITTPTGEGWYDADSFAVITAVNPDNTSIPPYSYFFAGWTSEDMEEIGDEWALSTTVLMDKAKTVTANYQAMIVATSGKGMGFWSNNNGQSLLTLADAKYLRPLPPYIYSQRYPKEPNNTRPFDTLNLNTFKRQIRDFLRNANATDMRYMLAAQLLATKLNVLHNFLDSGQEVWVDDGDSVYEPDENPTIGSIMADAITEWSSGTRTTQEYVKNLLDKTNNNLLRFISGSSIWRVNTPSQTNIATMSEKTTTVIPVISVNPNPLTAAARINYTLPVAGNVSIKLFDASGRVVEAICNGYKDQGTYSTNLSASRLAKGIYFLKFATETYNHYLKLIVQ